MITFTPEGQARSFTLKGAPATLSETGRRLTAPQIELGFAEARVESARATGGVRVESDSGHAQADQGSVGFDRDGAAQNMTLDGNVLVDDQGRKGQATRAVEVAEGGVWILTGDAAQAARVESAGSRLSADRIELDRPRRQIRGEGRARAVFSPDSQRQTITFVGDPKRPAYGKADRITIDDSTHLVTLNGAASLWQETSSLFADDITLSDVEKSVTAVNSVRAVMSVAKDAEPHPTAAAEKPAASVILARRLVYRDTDRSARFDGGVGACLRQPVSECRAGQSSRRRSGHWRNLRRRRCHVDRGRQWPRHSRFDSSHYL